MSPTLNMQKLARKQMIGSAVPVYPLLVGPDQNQIGVVFITILFFFTKSRVSNRQKQRFPG